MRIKLTVAYDGTDFCGWAAQTGRRTVQGTLREAVRRISGEDVEIAGASRTDSGAHAEGQVAHFDSEVDIEPVKWARVLNKVLEPDVRVVSSTQMADDFNSRFWAKDRFYRYRFLIGQEDPFRNRYVHAQWSPLDLEKMREAARALAGEHYFLA